MARHAPSTGATKWLWVDGFEPGGSWVSAPPGLWLLVECCYSFSVSTGRSQGPSHRQLVAPCHLTMLWKRGLQLQKFPQTAWPQTSSCLVSQSCPAPLSGMQTSKVDQPCLHPSAWPLGVISRAKINHSLSSRNEFVIYRYIQYVYIRAVDQLKYVIAIHRIIVHS